MEKIPTAEEFLWNGGIITQGDTEPYGKLPNDKVPLVMIEFAKLHVEAALKAASINAETEEEVIKLNHYTNLQPLWAKDNLSKGGKYNETFKS